MPSVEACTFDDGQCVHVRTNPYSWAVLPGVELTVKPPTLKQVVAKVEDPTTQEFGPEAFQFASFYTTGHFKNLGDRNLWVTMIRAESSEETRGWLHLRVFRQTPIGKWTPLNRDLYTHLMLRLCRMYDIHPAPYLKDVDITPENDGYESRVFGTAIVLKQPPASTAEISQLYYMITWAFNPT